MKLRCLGTILTATLLVLTLSSCSSDGMSGESGEGILAALESIQSVDTSIFFELTVHSGVSGLPDSHAASITSDIAISSALDPVSYHTESYSKIVVDGVSTREDKEYYVVQDDDGYYRYEYNADTDAWSVSELSKSEILSLPIETGFVTDWADLLSYLEDRPDEVTDDGVEVVPYTGDVPADILQDFFGNSIFGSFLYSVEYLLTNEIPCAVYFSKETGFPLQLTLDFTECFIVDDMTVDYGAVVVTYSNFNDTDSISVPKKVSIVASNPAQDFYSSYYIWNLFLPYLNSSSSPGIAGNSGLSFEANWNTFQVRIDSGMTALPLNFSDLSNLGYELDPSYVSRTLEANQTMEQVAVKKGDDIIYCTFYNDQTNPQALTACKVVGFDLSTTHSPNNSIQVYLPGEITLGVSRDVLLSAYGTPDVSSSGFSADTYVWYNKGADGVSIMQQAFLAEISPVTGLVVRLSLQNVPVSVIGESSPSS